MEQENIKALYEVFYSIIQGQGPVAVIEQFAVPLNWKKSQLKQRIIACRKNEGSIKITRMTRQGNVSLLG